MSARKDGPHPAAPSDGVTPLNGPPMRDGVLRRAAAALNSRIVLRSGPLVLLALFLLPARAAALRGDDEWAFDLRGMLKLGHVTLWHQMWSAASHSVRPNMLAIFVSDPVLYLFARHPSEYHLYIVALTVVCAALLWTLAQRLTGSAPLSALLVVLFAMTLQFRFFHDALLGYYGATQWGVGLLLASLITQMKAFEGGRWTWAWALLTALLFGCAGLIEQWIPTLCAAHFCLMLVEARSRRGILVVVPVVAVGLLLILIGYLGTTGPSQSELGSGYSASFNVGHVLESLVIGWVPPLPTSNRVFSQGPIAYFYGNGNPYPLGGSPTPAEWLAATWRGIVVLLAVLCYWLRASGRPGPPPVYRTSLRLLAVGLPLWLVSPLLVVAARKYQVELSLTRGYLETLAQAAGVVLVMGALLCWIRPRLARAGRVAVLTAGVALGLISGFAAAVDGFNNIRVIALEQPVRHTRDLLETAAHDGVFGSIPERSTLLFTGVDMDWPTGAWSIMPGAAEDILYADSGRNYDVRPDADQQPLDCPASPTFPPQPCSPLLHRSAWVRVRAYPSGGTVIVAPIAHSAAATFQTSPATRLVVYVESFGRRRVAPPLLTGILPSGRPWTSSHLRFHLLRTGGGWSIYEAAVTRRYAPVARDLTNPASPVNFEVVTPPDQLAREFGTKQLLP